MRSVENSGIGWDCGRSEGEYLVDVGWCTIWEGETALEEAELISSYGGPLEEHGGGRVIIE
jgi:hypothetical protein